MTPAIEQLRIPDIPQAQALVELAEWNQLPDDWRRLLTRQPSGSFKAVVDGQLVGTVTTIEYGTALAWIGMMLVHPQARRQGIGRLLMERAIAYLQGRAVSAIGLDATPLGQPLYEQLGFQSAGQWQRCQRPAGLTWRPSEPSDNKLLGYTSLDDRLQLLDTRAFGVDRWSWIRSLARGSQIAMTEQGYGLLRPGRTAAYLGPIVAAEECQAEAIARQLLDEFETNCIWDLPLENAAATKLAGQLGFSPLRGLTRMWLGSHRPPPTPRLIYAISDPATA